MDKPAQTDHPVHPLIERRWSPRAFSDKEIDHDILKSILEAARWAPSCFNDQPWFFMVATRDDPAEYDRLLSCLTPGNQNWARQAPVLMISIARNSFERNGKPNRYAFHDVGLAAASLVIQAMSMDIFVHQMGGIERDKIRETYHIPEGYEPVAGFALGYGGDPNSLPDDYREREMAPRERKPLPSFVFSGRWGDVSPVVSD